MHGLEVAAMLRRWLGCEGERVFSEKLFEGITMNVLSNARVAFNLAWLSACGTLLTLAAEPVPDQLNSATQQAKEFVQAALEAEAEGDFLARQSLLQSAASCAADYPALKWQKGYVKFEDTWLSIDDFVDKAAEDPLLAEYESRRAQLSETLQHHLALAQWCAERKLHPQARAHFERVIQFDSDHIAARFALGYQLIAGEWISPQQMAIWAANGESVRASLETYQKQLRDIAEGLSQPNPTIRQAARQSLMELRQAACIPAVESVFRNANEEVSLVVVEWLNSQDSIEGSLALLNYVVQHSSAKVRERATQALKKRPLHDYVPQLLNMLNSPVFAMAVPSFDRFGRLAGYQQAFVQEGIEQTKVLAVTTQINRTRQFLLPTDPSLTLQGGLQSRQLSRLAERIADEQTEQSARDWAEFETRTRASLAQQRNQGIEYQNRHVLHFLSQIAEREFSNDPREAWQWWDDVNETGYQKFKPVRYREQQQGLTLARYQPDRPSCECFVAGTPVLTTLGLKPIESIVAGDRVFTRDVVSGELLIKPVLRATQRPAEPTFEVVADDDRLQCTGGHLFWVSGSGWKKASELAAGDVLHAASEPAVLVSVKPSASQVTYNLQVADCNTFFVGHRRILSHDVTQRRGTDQIVPGLKARP